LNLKYAARLRGNIKTQSYFEIHTARFDDILRHVVDFCDAFSNGPIFIKLTRELPWLTPCKESWQFLQTILDQAQRSRKVGLIIANTRQTRVPADLIHEQQKAAYPGELAGGVLAGEQLYIETYSLIRNFVAAFRQHLTGIPIIATGGITTLSSFLEMVYAGAPAAQLFTAFRVYRIDYYKSLVRDLTALIENAQFPSYAAFFQFIQEESEQRLKTVRFHALHIPVRNREALLEQLRQQKQHWLRLIAKQGELEISQLYTDEEIEEGVTIGACHLMSAKQAGYPFLNATSKRYKKARLKRELERVRVACTRASFTGHILVQLLAGSGTTYEEEAFESNFKLIERMTLGGDWDLALLTEAYLEELCRYQDQLDESHRPVILGLLMSSSYHLCHFVSEFKEVTEIYNFGGKEAELVLERLADRNVIPRHITRTVVRTDELIVWLRYGRGSACFLAKDPLCALYMALAGSEKMHRQRDERINLFLLGSIGFCRRMGVEGLLRVYADIRAGRAQSKRLEADQALYRLLERETEQVRLTYLKF
jgi:hypothetical protein